MRGDDVTGLARRGGGRCTLQPSVDSEFPLACSLGQEMVPARVRAAVGGFEPQTGVTGVFWARMWCRFVGTARFTGARAQLIAYSLWQEVVPTRVRAFDVMRWIAWVSGEADIPGPRRHVADLTLRFHNVRGMADDQFRGYYLGILVLAETGCRSAVQEKE